MSRPRERYGLRAGIWRIATTLLVAAVLTTAPKIPLKFRDLRGEQADAERKSSHRWAPSVRGGLRAPQPFIAAQAITIIAAGMANISPALAY